MNFHGGDIYSYQNEVIDFSSNINPLGVPDSFKKVLRERINDFTYYPDLKYRELRSVLAEYLNFDNPRLLIPGNGAVELIFKTIAALQCAEVVVLSPTFSEYARAARQNGAEVIDLPAYDESFSHINFKLLFANVRPRSLVVFCNPNNPTGTLVDREEMCRVASLLQEKGAFLLVDEAFIEFTENYPGNSMVSELARFPHLVVVRAATKFFGMPGVRLGFAATKNVELAQAIENLLEPWNVNTAAVLAGCTVYRDREYINRSVEWAVSERKYLFARLQEIPGLMVYPSQVNYHLAKVAGETLNAWELKELMVEKGILIRTPDGFNYLSPYHFRLAVKDRQANDRLVNSLREVLSAHGQHK